MLSTLRRLIARALSTEIGVLGDDLKQLRADLNELGEDYAAHKVSYQRFQNRSGMRWARSGAGQGDELTELLKAALTKKSNGGNPDFPD